MTITDFSTVWVADVNQKEAALDGRGGPSYLTAMEVHSGHRIHIDLPVPPDSCSAPYDSSPNSLLVSYGSEPLLACHVAHGWPMPVHLLDLSVEFRNLMNGLIKVTPRNLSQALSHFRLDLGRTLQRYSTWDVGSDGMSSFDYLGLQRALTNDAVLHLELLLGKMTSLIDLPFAVHRGNFLKVVTEVEARGVPLDHEMLCCLKASLPLLRRELIQDADDLGLYEHGKLSRNRLAVWAKDNHVLWPQLEKSTVLKIDVETLAEQSKSRPELTSTSYLQRALAAMGDIHLQVGEDGRSREAVRPFSAKTSRNQPSSDRFIFSAASWLRPLITPKEGFCLIELDWAQQEFGIAAALSGDIAMQDAYHTGDPYLAFAKQAGVAPADATKATHAYIREQFKECALGVLYGMGANLLSKRIGRSLSTAKSLLRAHKHTYPTFWNWSEALLDYVALNGTLHTVFGWQQTFPSVQMREPSIRNFPMQANGSEMMRTAAVLMTQAGVKICAIIHDGFLIEAPVTQADDVERKAADAMREASGIVLGGFELRSEPQRIHSNARYKTKKGQLLWEKLQELLPIVRLDKDFPVSPVSGEILGRAI